MKELMSYGKFKGIINTLLEFQKKRDVVSKFFEEELMEDSFCFVTFGTSIESALVNLLADEFDCWYTFKEDIKDFNWWATERAYGMENDIADWLYSLDEEKAVYINDQKIDITSTESFYDFLVSQYKKKHNLTD
jgi:hypothetical protein